MRRNLTALFFLFLICLFYGQSDSLIDISASEPLFGADDKSKEISINLSNEEELDFALKKIHTFRYLESLVLEGEVDEANLKKLLYRLSVLKNLSAITFRDNELTKIPDNLSGIKTLRVFTIQGNVDLNFSDMLSKIKSIPLTEFNLIDNDIKKIPNELSELKSLKKITLSGNDQLDYSGMVDELAKLPQLTTLAIPVNYISELPKNIAKLERLQVLDVSNNNLMELPGEISALKAINNLSIQGNLLIDPAKDLEKLKGNSLKYLSLDKEISGDDLEKIKKIFPDVKIDFPVNKAEDEPESPIVSGDPGIPISSGELKAKKDLYVLSGAYMLYASFFQGLVYNFDTLTFEQRYKDFNYESTFQSLNNRRRSSVSIFLHKHKYATREKPGKRRENWFWITALDPGGSSSYSEVRSFLGMYWIYDGPLSKRQFKRKFLKKKQRVENRNFFGLGRKYRREPALWNDIRIDFDKNNSVFKIQLKGDSSFTEFNAYPVFADLPLLRSRQVYNQRYLIYKKALAKRGLRFNLDLSRNRQRYDRIFKNMETYAWKELQKRMSNDEKAMSKEEWLNYYDAIIAAEQKVLEQSNLVTAYILRDLELRGYINSLIPVRQAPQTNTFADDYGNRMVDVDFIDSKTDSRLPVSSIYVLDNKNKAVLQANGGLGFSSNPLTLKQFSSCTIMVELRNGNWGTVAASEIDAHTIVRGRALQLKTLVFDKNLDTIGDLLNTVIK